ncbi:hypothetical protein [Paenibacillus larvae]|uniref:Uncharacterized protein n=1 Tax=Paenibacillus larvae subsp. larvae TaxID=147375 RepID=A0A6C0QS75_9BACL|nr:hypothetical protein [Paenibacillus larvae]QHZ51188.1 hypothetical protein ERICV_02040 [Paenibacillus larvae subsp. larvae]QHZ52317.1 hypothetical protein ERICV_03205 [Paenibacillus larvae subsp. larvae]
MEQVERAKAYIKRALKEKIRRDIETIAYSLVREGQRFKVEEGTAYKYCGILEHDGEPIDKWYGDSKTQVYLDFIGEFFNDE